MIRQDHNLIIEAVVARGRAVNSMPLVVGEVGHGKREVEIAVVNLELA